MELIDSLTRKLQFKKMKYKFKLTKCESSIDCITKWAIAKKYTKINKFKNAIKSHKNDPSITPVIAPLQLMV